MVSLLYLFGFWGSFNINILEYIALSDVVKNALYPLLYSTIFIVLGFSIGNVVSVPLSKVMPPGSGKNLPEAKYVLWTLRSMAILMLGLALYVVLFQEGNYRWFKVAILVHVPVFMAIGNAEFASNYIQNNNLRVFIVNSLCMVFLYAFGSGALHAERVKNSDKFIKINNKRISQKYVGWAGDYIFLWDESEKTLVAKSKSTIKSLEFKISPKSPIIDLSTEGNKKIKEEEG